jgi:uncharacterized membrane protein
MEIIHSWYTNLETVASAIKLILESVSVFCVAMGLIAALVMVLGSFFRTGRFISSPHAVRLKFGTWLGMALEFQLGADIVATTVNPTLQSLTELAILAAVRTFLNYFLQKELEAEERFAARLPDPEVVATADKRGPENPECA